MIIDLGVINDEQNKLNKTIYDRARYEGVLRQETSVINPVFTIEAENLSTYNYVYIPEFRRYYFITDIVCIRSNLWRISAHVDVLMSYHDELLNVPLILTDSQELHASDYMSSDVWKTLVKTKTDIINFSSGLNNSGEYILITSGG